MNPNAFSREFEALHRKALRNFAKVPRNSRYYPLLSRLICMELEASEWPAVKRYLTNFKRYR